MHPFAILAIHNKGRRVSRCGRGRCKGLAEGGIREGQSVCVWHLCEVVVFVWCVAAGPTLGPCDTIILILDSISLS